MALPVGVQTKTLSIGRPFDALGNYGTLRIVVTPVFGGTAQRLVWSATGETFEVLDVTPPAQSDPDGDATETIDLPIVDQAGWLDGSGNAITGWSYQVSVTPTFGAGANKKKLKTYTKFVSPLSTHSSPIDMDKLADGTAASPVLAAGPALLGATLWVALARNPDQLVAGTITRDTNGAATSAPVVWPDGTGGTYTADTLSTAFPGAVDAYHITYGSPVSKTYTQPAVTRDPVTGAATNVPAIVVS